MAAVPVVWTSLVNTTATGNNIKKTSGGGTLANAAALSQQALVWDGYVEFVMPTTTYVVVAGLGVDPGVPYTGIQYGLSFNATTTVEVRERGTYRGEFTYAAGDTFRIEYISHVVKYYLNGVLKLTSPTAANLPLKLDVVFQTLNAEITNCLIETGPLTATVPMTYNAIDDRIVRPDTPTPVIGGMGSFIRDPDFDTRVIRLTDASLGTLAGTPVNTSYHTASAPNQSSWNWNGTKIYVKSDSGTVFVFNVDRNALLFTFDRTLAFGLEPAFPRVSTKPNIIYGVRFIAFHVIEIYDWTTGLYTTLLDLRTIDATLDETVFTNSVYVSGGNPERLVALYGGSNQNLHMKVTWFDVDVPTVTHTINTMDSTIDGAPLLDDTGAAVNMHETLHSIAFSHDGNTIRMDPINTSSYFWEFDIALGRMKKVTAKTAGHYALGWGACTNEDASGSAKLQWQWRTLDFASVNSPIARITTPQVGMVYSGDHQSWANARSIGDAGAPFFSESAWDPRDPFNFWSNEIIAVTSQGPEHVWRFCHHRMDGRGDIVALNPFEYQPLAIVDPPGEFVAFSSNWAKTLGLLSPAADPEAAHRVDVFVVQLLRLPPQVYTGGIAGTVQVSALTQQIYAPTTFLDNIVAVLQAAGVGQDNVNIFRTTKAVIPSGNGPYLTVVETGGSGPEGTHNDGIAAYLRPNLSMIVRGNNTGQVRDMIRKAYDALVALGNKSQRVQGVWYRSAIPLQEPFDTGIDGAGRWTMTVNFAFVKRPNAVMSQ